MPDAGPGGQEGTERFEPASKPVPAARPRRVPRSNTLAIALDNDSRVADLATKRGLVDDATARECLRAMNEARGRGESVSLAGLMVRKGLLTKYQASELTAAVATTGRGELIGGFRIMDKLGEGAMGAVYMAVQLALDRVVALKVLPERLRSNQEYIERFLREAKVAARLEHTNVVRAIDIGESNGKYYFAMEHVEGRSLESVLRERGSLAEEEALDVAVQAAQGLVCAWRNGLVHRDIKPDNILVTYDGVVKIADLGLAKGVSGSDDKRLTQEGMALGSPHYISPEQARAEEVDIRTDIYALGVTLYRMLAGAFPFDGDTPVKIIRARLSDDAMPLRQVNPKVTKETELVVSMMMAKDRDDRYPDPSVLLYDLELVAGGGRPEYAVGGKSARIRVVESARERLSARRSILSAPIRTLGRRPGLVLAAAAVLVAIGGTVAAISLLGREPASSSAEATDDTTLQSSEGAETGTEPSAMSPSAATLIRAALVKAIDGEHDEALALLERAADQSRREGDVPETEVSRDLEGLRRHVLRAKLVEDARTAEIAGRPADALPLYLRALEIADDARLRERVEAIEKEK